MGLDIEVTSLSGLSLESDLLLLLLLVLLDILVGSLEDDLSLGLLVLLVSPGSTLSGHKDSRAECNMVEMVQPRKMVN